MLSPMLAGTAMALVLGVRGDQRPAAALLQDCAVEPADIDEQAAHVAA